MSIDKMLLTCYAFSSRCYGRGSAVLGGGLCHVKALKSGIWLVMANFPDCLS